MKKYLVLLVLLVIIGCRSYHINIHNDSYLEKSTISMDMYHKSFDWRNGQIWSGKYYREIVKNEPQTIWYYIELRCHNVAAEILKDAFIQIDAEKNTLKMVDKKEVIEHIISDEMWNSGSKRMITVAVEINKNIERKILNASNIEYRLYIDKEPVTLTVTDRQLGKIKEFINTK